MGATVAYQLLLIALIFVRPDLGPPGTQSASGSLGATAGSCRGHFSFRRWAIEPCLRCSGRSSVAPWAVWALAYSSSAWWVRPA